VPRYELNRLGADEFEALSQSLVKAVIGNGSITFGPGRDGAREATFEGTAESYPSDIGPWHGRWLFQAKFHDLNRIAPDKARQILLSELDDELDKVVNKYGHQVDHYILITNVPVTGVHLSGTRDKIDREIAPKYSAIRHVHVWGYDDIVQFLVKFPAVRQAYLHFITPGDVLAELMATSSDAKSVLATTLRMYLSTAIQRDGEAQLDQAGEVGEHPIKLERIFIDINSTLGPPRQEGLTKVTRNLYQYLAGQEIEPDDGFSTLKLLLSEEFSRVVLVGGPGEGKSTIGQYLAQLHRGALLNRSSALDPEQEFVPVTPRLPFRVHLKEYAQALSDTPDTSSLEDFLAQDVSRLSTRACTTEDIHTLTAHNPVLLILDGLDEVMEPEVRTLMLERIDEYIARCSDVLEADLQVVATSRPTAYSGQFSSDEFLHLTLAGLTVDQISDYMRKWSVARQLDDGKARRLKQTMAACIEDPQISLLTNTPLQVTILILIILSGGTPPKQREALFDDYLEVIYKRERAKAPSLIKTERQLLFGLHQYIGYLLHREAATTQNVSAELDAESYAKAVRTYLRFNDPYLDSAQLDEQVNLITREAGQRFVLLVESTPGTWGFELRSIQEFFAAAHLTDTASDSNQRAMRFETICRSPHWHNVALFFAGRVGRRYSGEASNLVEVCRAIDREEPDSYVRRGCSLALELAADRAFGPNRRLQHSVVEYGLTLLDEGLRAGSQAHAVSPTLQRLSREDIDRHVLPSLNDKLSALAVELLLPVIEVANSVGGSPSSITPGLRRLVGGSSGPDRFKAVLLAVRVGVDPTITGRWITEFAEDASDAEVAQLAELSAIHTPRFLDAVTASTLSAEMITRLCDGLLSELVIAHPRPIVRNMRPSGGLEDWRNQLRLYLAALGILARERQRSYGMGESRSYRSTTIPRAQRATLEDLLIAPLSMESILEDPPSVDFGLPSSPVANHLAMVFWAIHLRWGQPSLRSGELFLEFVSSLVPGARPKLLGQVLFGLIEPLPSLELLTELPRHSAAAYVAEYCGRSGLKNWQSAWREIGLELDADDDRALSPLFTLLGPHAPMDDSMRSSVYESLDHRFGDAREIAVLARNGSYPRWADPEPPQLSVDEYGSAVSSLTAALANADTAEIGVHLHAFRSLLSITPDAQVLEGETLLRLTDAVTAAGSRSPVLQGYTLSLAAAAVARTAELGATIDAVSSALDVIGEVGIRCDEDVYPVHVSPNSSQVVSGVALLVSSASGRARIGASMAFKAVADLYDHAFDSVRSETAIQQAVAPLHSLLDEEAIPVRRAGLASMRLIPPTDSTVVEVLCQQYERAEESRYRHDVGSTLRAIANSVPDPTDAWIDAIEAILRQPDSSAGLRAVLVEMLARLVAVQRFDIVPQEQALQLPLAPV